MYCSVKEQKCCLSPCSVVRTEYPKAESFIEEREREIWGANFRSFGADKGLLLLSLAM